MPRKWTIFNAWESDLPRETNTDVISWSLNRAAQEIMRRNSEVEVVIDHATREMSGSDNIPQEIARKIDACDIFLADVSTITPKDYDGRPCQNPNVTFELGYAAAQVGWRRIILLINKEFTEDTDLPFDFDRHRVSKYLFSTSSNPGDRNALVSLLVRAISIIIEKDPKRPYELRGKSEDEIKRERDIENAIWALKHINTQVLQQHTQALPDSFPEIGTYLYDGYHEVIENYSFHIYDDELDAAFRNLDEAWTATLAYPGCYHSNDHGTQIFSFPRDFHLREEREQYRTAITQSAFRMAECLKELLRVIRLRYIEIHIDDTDRYSAQKLRELQSAWTRDEK